MPLTDLAAQVAERQRHTEFEERYGGTLPRVYFCLPWLCGLTALESLRCVLGTWQEVGTKMEPVVSCLGGGPRMEEGWLLGIRSGG